MLAITRKTISFTNLENKIIHIPAGSEIYVDLEEGVAFGAGCHFSVDSSDYILYSLQ